LRSLSFLLGVSLRVLGRGFGRFRSYLWELWVFL
jgi:hypothetical protein